MSGPTFYSLLTFLILVNSCQYLYANDAVSWIVKFEPQNLTLHMDTDRTINVSLSNLNKSELIATNATIYIRSDSDILQASKTIAATEIGDNGEWHGNCSINAVFIGAVNIYVSIIRIDGREEHSLTQLPIIIIRRERLIDKLFIISVATLVSILYINFGAALDLRKVKVVLLRPIGPAIAFFCHFIFLPLVSD